MTEDFKKVVILTIVFALIGYLGLGLGLMVNENRQIVDKALAECEARLVSTNAPRNIKCTVEIRAISKAE